MGRYGEAVEEAMKGRQEPKRQRLLDKDQDALIALLRQERLEQAGSEAFLHEFNTWQWYVCTFKPKGKGTPNERVWKSVTQMKYESAPEVIQTLRQCFTDLEQRLGRASRAAGKS
jgi:hypothetical protein